MFCTILGDPINSNPFRFTSLDYAVSGNQHHIVEYMIEKKLLKGYEMKDAYGMSIFHRAAKYSDVKMLTLLLDCDGMPHWYGFDIIARPTPDIDAFTKFAAFWQVFQMRSAIVYLPIWPF